jgi:hypothetical protein
MRSSRKLYSDCFKSPCQRSAGIWSAKSDDTNDDWCVVSRIKREKNRKGGNIEERKAVVP